MFEFISNFGGASDDADTLQAKFEQLIVEEEERPEEKDAEGDVDDAVFVQSFIPRSLSEVLASCACDAGSEDMPTLPPSGGECAARFDCCT